MLRDIIPRELASFAPLDNPNHPALLSDTPPIGELISHFNALDDRLVHVPLENQTEILFDIADILEEAYRQTDEEEFALRALQKRRDGVSLLPAGAPVLPLRQYELACSYYGAYEITLDAKDFDSAIDVMGSLAQAYPTEDVPQGLPNRLSVKTMHAGWCQAKAEITRAGADVERALGAFESLLPLRSPDHAAQTKVLTTIGQTLLMRYELLGHDYDKTRAFVTYEDATRIAGATPLSLLYAALDWASKLQHYGDGDVLRAFSRVFECLDRVMWRGYGQAVRHSILSSIVSLSIPALAAENCVRAGRLETALEWLDHGRSIVWTQSLQLRTPLERLRADHPAVAARLESAGHILEQDPADLPTDASLQNVQFSIRQMRTDEKIVEAVRLEAAHTWDAVVEEIRSFPGYERFLRPHTHQNLRTAARFGPVVLLFTTERCGWAILVSSPTASIASVELPKMSLHLVKQLNQELGELIGIANESGRSSDQRQGAMAPWDEDNSETGQNERFALVLQTIWDDLVHPVTDALGLKKRDDGSASKLPRIWWCASGPMTRLPLHAAGIYTGPRESQVSVTDLAISSYVPILSLMLPPWTPTNPQADSILKPRALIVGQANAPGTLFLPAVAQELSTIQDLCKASGAPYSLLQGQDANSRAVLSALNGAQIVHFACHGVQAGTGWGSSALLLADGRLDMNRIIQHRFPNARLAFLSACHTTRGDLEVPDESTHIAAAILFAGCQSVVGTQWAIVDADGPTVSKSFYSSLFNGGHGDGVDVRGAAVSLHQAVQKLKESGVSFMRWVPFVHLGI